MAYLMFKKSSSSSKKDVVVVVVGKSKHHDLMMIKCKKHPKHKQSPGVCSLCLREKLSQISSTSSSSSSLSKCVTLGSYSSSSSYLSSYYSSYSASCSSSSSSSYLSSYYSSYSASCSSSCSSPMHKFANDHQGKQYSYSLSTSLFSNGGKNNKVLTKSRSLAFVPRMGSDDKQGNETKKKPHGIFSKLLKPTTKKIDEAKTTKEILVAI